MKNSLWQLPNYTTIQQIRNGTIWGIALYFHNRLNFTPTDKNINNNDIDCLNIETVKTTSKNVIIFCIYRPPIGGAQPNVNSLDYSRNTLVRDIFNFVFQNGILPVINWPTRLTK